MTTATIKPFKSARAARIAYGKAERHAETARNEAHHSFLAEHGYGEAYDTMIKPLDEAETAAWANAKAIYDAATAQKFWIDSYHFGHNPTRDLIRANMD